MRSQAIKWLKKLNLSSFAVINEEILKALILLPLILLLLGKILSLKFPEISGVFISGSLVSFVVLIITLFKVTNRPSLTYKIIFSLLILSYIGLLLKIMHWPGANLLLAVGLLAVFLIGIVFLMNSIKNPQNKLLLCHLALGLLLLIQLFLPLSQDAGFTWAAKFFNYLIVGLVGGMILNRLEKNEAEKNILILIFIQGWLFIIKDGFELI